ncbi:MAG: PAS domain-containing protein, partial [Candidatus Lokiarchaeota archaeon]|nr:PAS domain-containing protein [Candidatus Lokiarchaeota archaeon]
MNVLLLSYFDSIQGPRIFLKAPENIESIEEKKLENIPTLMDIYDRGFFIHISEGIKSANLIFKLKSEFARGGMEVLLISMIVDMKNEIDLNLTKDLFDAFVDELQDIKDIYKAFYINSEKHEGDEDKYQNLKSLLNKLQESIEPAVKALQLAENRYRMLFKNARDAIVMIDKKDGKIIDVNDQAEKLLSLSRKW